MSIIHIAVAAAEHAEHHEETLLGLGAEGWVYVGITLFFVLAIFVGKAHRQVAGILDEQIAETRKSLDEASAIRAEAEALLAEAKRQQAASESDAKALVEHAKHEAEAIVAKAESDTAALVARREKIAEDKISAAERAAVDKLRARTAELSAAAALELISKEHTADADKKLVDLAISGI